jgi:hypothetical protein
MALSAGSQSYFYLVPAFTVAVSVQEAHQLDGFIHLPDASPHTIHKGAHIVFDHSNSNAVPQDSASIHAGTTYFVSHVEIAGVRRRIKVSRHGPSAKWCDSKSHNSLPRGTVATFAVHAHTSECNKAPELFAADIQAFQQQMQCISALARPPLQLSLSSHPFEQVFPSQPNPTRCWRALLKVSAAADIDIRRLRAAGHVLLYPAHQFALQALMGVSSSQTLDLTKACGGAFLDTMTEDLWQPADSLEEYCKRTAFNNIRNIFAHSFEQSSSTALLDAAKTWCFNGTKMQTQDSSSFWVNSDVLSYVFTATPLAFFLPLCYRAVCSKLRERRKAGKVILECNLANDKRDTKPATLRVFDFTPDLQKFINEDHCMVTLDQHCGPLQKGVTYHVASSTHATEPSSRTTCGVSLRRKGDPVVLLEPVSRPQAAAQGPSAAAASSPFVQATFQRPSDYLQEDAILSCMPADLPPREVPSLLDLYFNYNKPLSELMSQLERGMHDEELFDTVCAGNIKKHQYSGDNIDGHAIGSLFCQRFATLRKAFNDKVAALFRLHQRNGRPECGKDMYADVSLWCRDAGYSIDSSAGEREPKVWLGLSRVGKFEHPDLDVRIPRAIKSQPPERSPEFEKLMATLKTGSNIASATKHRCLIVNSQQDAYPEIPLTDEVNSKNLPEEFEGKPFAGEAWVSEAGICTLKELFANGVSDAERRTFAFRNLMRQVRCAAWTRLFYDCESLTADLSRYGVGCVPTP